MRELTRTRLASALTSLGRFHNQRLAALSVPDRDQVVALFESAGQPHPDACWASDALLRTLDPHRAGALHDCEHTVHLVVEGRDQEAADRGHAAATEIARRCGGVALPPTVPLHRWLEPFPALGALLHGPDGASAVNTLGCVPMSRAEHAMRAVDAYFASQAERMARSDILEARIYVAPQGLFGIEPLLFWPDAASPLRISVASPAQRDQLRTMRPDPVARATVIELRLGLIEVFRELGAAYYQIGKLYPYRAGLAGSTADQLLATLKRTLDPCNMMNPGALGLSARE